MKSRLSANYSCSQGILLFLLLSCLILPQTLFADDTEAPQLTALDFTPQSIDTSTGSADVTLTLQITDDLSGLDYGYLYFYSPSNQQYKYIYVYSNNLVDDVNDIYQVTGTFPQNSESGEWRLYYIQFYDKTTNNRIYYEQDLIGRGFPTKLNITSVADITGPDLLALDFAPKSIDTSTGPADITLTLQITDDLSGLNYGYLYFYSPSNQQYKYIYVYSNNLVDDVNDIYQVTGTFPQSSESGEWYLRQAYFYDKTTNTRNYYEQNLIGLGFPTKLNIFSDTQDIVAPVLEDLEITPHVVNTILGPDTATFTAKIIDELSGLSYGYIRVTSPSGGQNHNINVGPYNLIDDINDIYQTTKVFPQYTEYGEWKINYAYFYDNTTNRRYYYEQDLIDAGLPASFLMEGSIVDPNNPSGDNIIGPEGGVIETGDGILTLEFPEGALPDDTEISLTRIGRFEPVDIMIGTHAGQGNSIAEYNIEPDGLEFDVPVILTMTVDVTEMNQNERNRLNIYLYTDTNADGTPDTFIPLTDEQILEVVTTVNPDGTVIMTFTVKLEHFSIYAIILPIEDDDTTPPEVEIVFPQTNLIVQGGFNFAAQAEDDSAVETVKFYIREAGPDDGVIIGYEEIAATRDVNTGLWKLYFDSTQLLDGYYFVFAEAVDEYGNKGTSEVVPFSIRNWAVVEMLPVSETYRAGRTMPIKFSLRISEAVDPAMPFVYNEQLKIDVYETSKPGTILQSTLFGDTSTDYRINGELYITNFKTDKKPAEYTVDLWRVVNDFLIDSFTFETTQK